MVTLQPRPSSRHPIDADANPFPSELNTPPVTKMYFVCIFPPDSIEDRGTAPPAEPILHYGADTAHTTLPFRKSDSGSVTQSKLSALLRLSEPQDFRNGQWLFNTLLKYEYRFTE